MVTPIVALLVIIPLLCTLIYSMAKQSKAHIRTLDALVKLSGELGREQSTNISYAAQAIGLAASTAAAETARAVAASILFPTVASDTGGPVGENTRWDTEVMRGGVLRDDQPDYADPTDEFIPDPREDATALPPGFTEPQLRAFGIGDFGASSEGE